MGEPRICKTEGCGHYLGDHETVPSDRSFDATFKTTWPCDIEGCRCKDFTDG